MSKRNYTRELRRAADQGAKIVCSVAPYAGVEVDYSPRKKGDPQPWVLVDQKSSPTPFRYSGCECRAEGRNGGPWALAKVLRINVS
jgi:hypothetical protein